MIIWRRWLPAKKRFQYFKNAGKAVRYHITRDLFGSKNPGGVDPITYPYLRFAAALPRIARPINRIEDGLLPVEIGAVEHVAAEADDPPRIPAALARLELHYPNWPSFIW